MNNEKQLQNLDTWRDENRILEGSIASFTEEYIMWI